MVFALNPPSTPLVAGLQLLRAGFKTSMDSVRVGDLLFYKFSVGKCNRLHVMVCVGGGRAIHASVGYNEVCEIDVNDARWTRHFVTSVSLLYC